jgi:putative transcriptional regulator
MTQESGEADMTAFNKIMAGLLDAGAIARGEKEPPKLFVPPEIDVKAIRNALKMSQPDFANTFGFSIAQVRNWEQGRNRPLGAMRAYMIVIQRDPKSVTEALKNMAA